MCCDGDQGWRGGAGGGDGSGGDVGVIYKMEGCRGSFYVVVKGEVVGGGGGGWC